MKRGRQASQLKLPTALRGYGPWAVAASVVLAASSRIEPTATTRLLVAAIAAVILLVPTLSAAGERRRTAAIVVIALGSLGLSVSSTLPDFATTWNVRVWNVYHYYLGSKYFKELGYTDLYDATLQADSETENYWADISRVRDLRTYEVRKRDADVEASSAFTPERWVEFQNDVRALSQHRPPRSWRSIFVDRGYNAPPFWTVVGATLARLAPADRPLALKLLCSLDILLLVASFGLLLRAFGVRMTALVLLLFTLSPVNLDRLLGGFLQYDWFCAVVLAACWLRLERTGVAAAAMAYAALTRMFPVLFVVSGLVPAILIWVREGPPPRQAIRFTVAFVGWCSLGLALSLANGRGADGWREFYSAIEVHREHHHYGEQRVGLPHLLTHDVRSLSISEDRGERELEFERQRPLYLVIAGGLTALFVVVVARRRSWKAGLLGLVPLFALLVTSRYYWSYLALLPLAGGRRSRPWVRARWIAGVQLAIFAASYAFQFRSDDRYANYIVFGALLLGYLVFVLLVLLPRTPSSEESSPAARSRTGSAP